MTHTLKTTINTFTTQNSSKRQRQGIWTRITEAASKRNHPQQTPTKHPPPHLSISNHSFYESPPPPPLRIAIKTTTTTESPPGPLPHHCTSPPPPLHHHHHNKVDSLQGKQQHHYSISKKKSQWIYSQSNDRDRDYTAKPPHQEIGINTSTRSR